MLEYQSKTFVIKPAETPAIFRNCPRCGHESEFLCSEKFRINAQQKNLDVWLIYNCKTCGCTWNMDILSRVNPKEIEAGLYEGFLSNSRKLAWHYAFDTATFEKNRVDACFDGIKYQISGEAIDFCDINKPLKIKIISEYNLHLRLDRVLAHISGLSRNRLGALLKSGEIKIDGVKNDHPANYKIRESCEITVNQAEMTKAECKKA